MKSVRRRYSVGPGVPAAGHAVGFEIKLHVVDTENKTRVGLNDRIENTVFRAAQKRLHARDQVDRGHRLDHEIVGTREEAPQALAFLANEREIGLSLLAKSYLDELAVAATIPPPRQGEGGRYM